MSVREGSWADENGIKVNDSIESINAKKFEGLSEEDAVSEFKSLR